MGLISRAAKRAANLPGSTAWSIHWQAMARVAAGEKIMVLSIGEPDIRTKGEVDEAGIEAVRMGAGMSYSQGGGAPLLKEAIAKQYGKLHDLDVDPKRVFVTAGAQNALFQVLRSVLDDGTEVIVPDPCYVTYHGTVVANGGSVVPLPLKAEDGFRIHMDSVRAKLTKQTRGIMVNSPNNPTGAILTRGDMSGLVDICKDSGLWLISDEVYSDYLFDGQEHVPSIAVPGGHEHAVCVNAASKAFSMVGWRVGWAVVPEPLIPAMQAVTEGMLFGISPIAEAAALKAIELGSEKGLGAEYSNRFGAIFDRLKDAPGLIPKQTYGGLFALADVRGTGLDAPQFAQRLLDDYDVSVLPADAFGHAAAGHIRISLTKSADQLASAAERIAECAAQVRKESGIDGAAVSGGGSGQFGSVLFCREGLDPTQYQWGTNVIAAIQKHGDGLTVKEWPVDDVSDVSAAVVWKPPEGLLAKMPKLEMVQVLGAGIDGVLSSFADLDDKVKICRLIDPIAVERMQSYVLAAAMDHVQHSTYFHACQNAREWDSSVGPERIADTTVAILGLGEMGRAAGELLSKAGFDVVGWSRSKRVPDSRLYGFRRRFVGDDERSEMLKVSDVVVSMLPLTPATHGILNKEFFSHLKPDTTFVSAGRGEHVVVPDLIEALDAGIVRSAILDVFDNEPLEDDSPLWTHPKVTITPHIAGAAGEASAGEAVAQNLNRVKAGEEAMFVVNKKGGY